ncbi:DUF3108 domain-containing protein [Wenzhouxiangella sp. 15190]|uniref:DUF3108 domain-containing protein n=1 Tax=Wenzhouxiangella sp. 15190 TaxID=2301225 RepID=UPI0015F2A49A|nr:DUF3108 domain-containing protein [Wenzhouxiangella sp. 15190]
MTAILILTAICSTTAMAADGPPLPAHEATYEVLRHGKKVGELMVSLEQLDTGVWHYQSDTRATAWWARALDLAAEEAAHFVWRDDRIMMLTYHHAQHAPANNRFFQHRTDWEAGTTRVRTENGSQTVELVDNMVDPLSLRLQLAVNLADESQRRTTHDFTLLDRDEVKHKRYTFDGEERIDVPAGCFDAVRIRRIEKPESDKNNLSWHAADFYWMPVRILRQEDGKDKLDIRLLETDLPLNGC